MNGEPAQTGGSAGDANSLASLQSELAQAKAELERLKFHISHDLRAPLRHIRAFVQVIEEDHASSLEEPVRAHLKTILQSADRAMKILDGLLEAPDAPVGLKP